MSIAHVLKPKPRDLGSFMVRRVLPSAETRMVGPFIFFDHMGPVTFQPGEGMDVRPHPHIGLATVTYLFDGEILHRDSLGFVQAIRPGDVNWMTAGRGIVHSERTDPALRRTGFSMHGIQSWIALPKEAEETAPAFVHHPSASLPDWREGEVQVKLIAGEAWGRTSPVATASRTLYADLAFAPSAVLGVPADHQERAVYVAEGNLAIGDTVLPAGQMAVLTAGATPELLAGPEGARAMLLGGDAMDGPRHIWWNFVSSSEARIAQAKADWAAQAMGQVPGETEFIPLAAP
jgi:redox-sensitive bicupin YhaK (pirin superfamily)